jgi:hypothetical protein
MAAGHKWGWTPNIWPFENHVKGKMDFLNHWILWDPVKAGKPRDVLNAWSGQIWTKQPAGCHFCHNQVALETQHYWEVVGSYGFNRFYCIQQSISISKKTHFNMSIFHFKISLLNKMRSISNWGLEKIPALGPVQRPWGTSLQLRACNRWESFFSQAINSHYQWQ